MNTFLNDKKEERVYNFDMDKTNYQTWNEFFKDIKSKDYFQHLVSFLEKEYATNIVYPPKGMVFNAFKLTPLDKLKVVIIGQDPYHEPNQAMGLAFSIQNGTKLPPSLINIYKEIEIEYPDTYLNYYDGDLTKWAVQGVFMINTILSVKEHQPLSHDIPEYDEFMQDVLLTLNKIDRPIVFMLWGNFAKKYKKYLTNPKHYIIETSHPSPLSANRGGWFNQNQFIRCNDYLEKNQTEKINWTC